MYEHYMCIYVQNFPEFRSDAPDPTAHATAFATGGGVRSRFRLLPAQVGLTCRGEGNNQHACGQVGLSFCWHAKFFSMEPPS